MIKYIAYIVLGIIAVIGIASLFHLYRVSVHNKTEMTQYQNRQIDVQQNFGKVLVIYYSITGQTRYIAEKIKNKTHADLYEIKLAEPLPTRPKLYLEIKKQLKFKKYPALKQDFPALESYDLIFVGAPVWWYTIATPVLSFLEQTDFQGKRVVPFSTQGSNFGTFFEDFNEKAKNASVLKGSSFNNLPNGYEKEVDNKINHWLNSL